MSVSTEELQCYNKGCGQKFKIVENNDDSCVYHPGAPVFHDAYKSWSCCKIRSTDFTTFLNTKGCTVGKHNSEKPVEPVKETPDPNLRNEVITVKPNNPVCSRTRPSFDLPLQRFSISVTESLKIALEKMKEKEAKDDDDENVSTEGDIKKGESCKNNSCTAVFEGDFSDLENCKYHPGVPIFHEGLKYWSCCKKKSTDFDEFLNQQGCTVGKHIWFQKTIKKVQSCRYDWHQTGTHVFVTVYAKNPQPDFTYIDANPIRLKLRIVFGDDEEFEIDSELRGIINVEESKASMAASKVEVKLRKGEPSQWPNLFIEENKIVTDENLDTEENNELCDEIETVDLSDI